MQRPLPVLTVPSNMQEDLVDLLDFTRIGELYGKLREDPLGGGRSSVILPFVSRSAARGHIRAVRDRGVSFNYLLNASCLDNSEFTRQGRRRIERAVRFVVDSGADTVTVMIPMLVEIIKKLEPSLKVSISTMAGVDSPEMAAYFEGLGADRITLSVTDVNRDFPRLAAIRKRVKLHLQVIANLECLRGCPFTRYHANLNSHASQEWHPSGGLVVDYCYLSCSILRLSQPAHFMMAGWIRPEDQQVYADAGIDSIKLVNRAMTSQQIAFVTRAYTAARHDGNLLELFAHPTNNMAYVKKDPLSAARYLLKPHRLNVLKLARSRDLFHWPMPQVDNRELSGFIDQFVKGRCNMAVCGTGCRYCFDWADRVFRMEPGAREKALAHLTDFREQLLTGSLFRWGK
jgi:collagenase-like PrtC family protease